MTTPLPSSGCSAERAELLLLTITQMSLKSWILGISEYLYGSPPPPPNTFCRLRLLANKHSSILRRGHGQNCRLAKRRGREGGREPSNERLARLALTVPSIVLAARARGGASLANFGTDLSLSADPAQNAAEVWCDLLLHDIYHNTVLICNACEKL